MLISNKYIEYIWELDECTFVYCEGEKAEYDGIYRCIFSPDPRLIPPCGIEITMKKDEKFPPHNFKEDEEHHDIKWSLIATYERDKVYVVVDKYLDRCFNSSYKPTTRNSKVASGIYIVMRKYVPANTPIREIKVFTQGDKIPPLSELFLVIASDTEENRKILFPPENK